MKCKVLHTRKLEEKHTAEAISASFGQCKEEWNLKGQIVFTDNAANELKVLEMLEWQHFGCMGHNMNLAVRKALSIPKVSRLVGKGRALIGHFHRSSNALSVLTQEQKLFLDPKHQGHR